MTSEEKAPDKIEFEDGSVFEKELDSACPVCNHKAEQRLNFAIPQPIKIIWKTRIVDFSESRAELYRAEESITADLNDGWLLAKTAVCRPYMLMTFYKQEDVDAHP